MGENRYDLLGCDRKRLDHRALCQRPALVGGADLVLLDEPTEGLAPYIVRDVMEIVEDLNERSITVLLVEQNVHACLELADRNYLINRCEIVYEGTSAELEADEEVLDRYLGVSG